MEIEYIGNELELFAEAHHWKAYWSRIVGPMVGRRVLDVGAGIGATARLMTARAMDRYVALEPDSALASRISNSDASQFPPSLEVVVGTLDDLPPSEEFDTILYIDVLEHIEDDLLELERAARHLQPGGRIIVLAPAHPFLYSPFDSAVGHVRRYTRGSLAAAKPGGLVTEQIRYLDCAGLLASIANRMLLRAALPTPSQIRLWDDWMVPASSRVDPLLRFSLGKTVLGSFRKPG